MSAVPYIPPDSGIGMTEPAKTERSRSSARALKLIVPVLGAAIIYAAYAYLYDGGLVIADDRVRYLLWGLSFIGLAAVIRIFFDNRHCD